MNQKCRIMDATCSGRAEHTRHEILAAAIHQFAAYGYAGSSTLVIAKAAHVSKPSLYYHFGSKAGLFRAVVDRTDDKLQALIGEIQAGKSSAPNQLVEIGAGIFQFACEHPQDMSLVADLLLVARQGPSPEHCIGKAYDRLAVFQKIMEQGMLDGIFRKQLDSQHMSIGFLGLLYLHILLRLANPQYALTRSTAEQAVSLFLEGAASKKRSFPDRDKGKGRESRSKRQMRGSML